LFSEDTNCWENSGAHKIQELKTQNETIMDQTTRHEKVGHENKDLQVKKTENDL